MTSYVTFLDQGYTDDEGLSKPYNDTLYKSGVAKGFQASQRGSGSNMSVDVSQGFATIARTTDLIAFPVFSDATENVAVTASNASNPRKDVLVAYVDPDLFVDDAGQPNNPGALVFDIIDGVAAATPTAPNDAAIQAAIGSDKPFIKLAEIAVAANATQIVDANITDLRAGMALSVFDYVRDRNRNPLLESSNTANAVNWLKVNNAANGTAVGIEAKGSDSNIDIDFKTKGAGVIKVNGQELVNNSGWITSTVGITAVTANGNGSYTLTTASDVRGFITPKMRGRANRTVSSPIQCANLNGTSQYFNRTSGINGLTATDDIASGAWIKLTNYPTSTAQILSRDNGSSGFEFRLELAGTVSMLGRNASSSNYSRVLSYSSVPLNKWIHVAAQLDMSAFTATATTSYVMVDGSDVAVSVDRGGTNPTSFVQAGNLEIGAHNGGLQLFPGRIAQAFVTSGKLTQAQVNAIKNQGITAADVATYNIVSAYSLSGASGLTDINTTNANNLTSVGSATATTNDAPFGVLGDGTNSANYDHFIVMATSSTNITVQVPEGSTLPTTGGITSWSYSSVDSPYNFPGSEDKWTIVQPAFVVTHATLTPAANTPYNPNSYRISIPTGKWSMNHTGLIQMERAASGQSDAGLFLSTTNASFTGIVAESRISTYGSYPGAFLSLVPLNRSFPYTASSQTVLYVNTVVSQPSSNLSVRGDWSHSGGYVITAKNAYL
jgi:hypothetical protein